VRASAREHRGITCRQQWQDRAASYRQIVCGRSNASSTGGVEDQLPRTGGSQRARTLSHDDQREAPHSGYQNDSHLSITYLKNGRDGGIRTRRLASSPSCSPNAHPATPVSASPTAYVEALGGRLEIIADFGDQRLAFIEPGTEAA